MNKLQQSSFMRRVDDTLCVLSTHGVAGLLGGLLVGILADPNMLIYIGTEKEAPGISVTGLLYGGGFTQLVLQLYAALFMIGYNAVATFIVIKIVSLFVSLRMDDKTLAVGDAAVHGEDAYAIQGDGQKEPRPQQAPALGDD
jgi:ammonium transporter, Amt family